MDRLMRSMLVLVALTGCHRSDQSTSDADKAATSIDTTANRLASAADRLADKADTWGDNASARVDAAGGRTAERIALANDRLSNLISPAASSPFPDHWLGRWTGVEGLVLVIEKDRAKGEGHYILHDTYSLDHRGVYDGIADDETIRFSRPDGDHVLRATNGQQTGLKYLASKQTCLTVQSGEGYCRD